MKESRYIELLNLYVDHQLTSTEAAELEVEVQRSSERRKTYLQYCRMQKACGLLFEADRTLAPKTAAAVIAIRNPNARRADWTPSIFGWGGLRVAGYAAAAACAVIVGLRFLPGETPSETSSNSLVAAVSPGLEARDAVARVASSSVVSTAEMEFPVDFPALNAQRSALQPVWFASSLRSKQPGVAEFGTETTADLAWLNQVSLPSVRVPLVEDLRFEARAESLSQPESPVYGGRRPYQGNVEMTAFQFQR